jgi:hypothetical protein
MNGTVVGLGKLYAFSERGRSMWDLILLFFFHILQGRRGQQKNKKKYKNTKWLCITVESAAIGRVSAPAEISCWHAVI